MGNVRGVNWHAHPVIERSVVRSCASESRGKHISNLPIRAKMVSANMSAHHDAASRDAEPDQLHDARRARVDVQHTTLTRVARLCVQDDRACRRRLEDDAPGDAELSAEVVGAGGKDDAADGGVGECAGQASAGAHRGLQLTAVAGHGELQTSVQPGNVAGLGAGQQGAPCKESEGTVHALLLSRPM